METAAGCREIALRFSDARGRARRGGKRLLCVDYYRKSTTTGWVRARGAWLRFCGVCSGARRGGRSAWVARYSGVLGRYVQYLAVEPLVCTAIHAVVFLLELDGEGCEITPSKIDFFHFELCQCTTK